MGFRLEHPLLKKIREEGGPDIIGEIADAARKTYCGLYSNNPGWIFVKNNFTLPIVKRMSDDLCGDFPPPPPPVPAPFTGGQCEGETYRVSVTFDRYFNGNFVQEQTFVFNGVPASIQGATTDRDPNDPRIGRIIVLTSNPPDNEAVTKRPYGGVGVTADNLRVSVEIEGGGDDNCGDPDFEPYPIDPPPQPADLNQTITITNNNGDTFDYDTSVVVNNDGYPSFPTTININSLSIGVDIGGFTINNNKGGGGAPPPPDLLDEEEEEKKEEGGTDIVVRVTPQGERENGHVRTVADLTDVTIDLVKIPKSVSVSGGLGSPDVRYAGWIEFKSGNYYYERKFFHFKQMRFIAPEKNDGYAVFYKEGYSGMVTETTETEVETEENTEEQE